MIKIDDWDNVQASKDFAKPGAGGYVFVIDSVVDKVTAGGKPYLEIYCDIAEGEFKGFAKQAEQQFGNKGSYRKMKAYYQGKASGLFKRFIENITTCNRGFKWNLDETILVGKVFGGVLAEREYLKQDNTIGLATEIAYPSTTTVDDIRKGNFKLIPLKKLDPSLVPVQNAPVDNSVVSDDDCPF